MKLGKKYRAINQKGFTLVELVVTIAILGILSATAVPMVTKFLGTSKEQAYNADIAIIQTAVNAWISSPSNIRFDGQRQYPIKGSDKTDFPYLLADEANLPGPLRIDGNPLGGTKGGNPRWTDEPPPNGNGIRDRSEEVLNGQNAANNGGWHVATVNREETNYLVDSRDYFIDFNKLVAAGLLDKVPASASTDTGGGSSGGSYSWYVDPAGNVRSVLFHFAEADQAGFQQVYP